MREMSVAEQRYLAVLAVIADGHDVTAAAQQFGVTRQTLLTIGQPSPEAGHAPPPARLIVDPNPVDG